MNSRRLALAALALATLAASFLFWPRARETPPRLRADTIPTTSPPPLAGSARPPASAAFDPADFPIAARLNAPDSTIARDLEILQQVFDTWRSNFPHDGNPVGENTEITAALAGENRLGFALIPKNHPAIDARGELCDRWGTPFRFHQLSGERMEIRSAGPDRTFATEDDAVWTPP